MAQKTGVEGVQLRRSRGACGRDFDDQIVALGPTARTPCFHVKLVDTTFSQLTTSLDHDDTATTNTLRYNRVTILLQ